jgi:hypothetical protein
MENLLDDNTIEGQLPSSFLTEIRGMGKWVLITAAMGVTIGSICGIISFFALTYGVWGFIEGVVVLLVSILGAVLFYFAYVQFRYARILKWLDVGAARHTLDDFIQYTHRTWRLFAVTYLLILILFILMTYVFLAAASMSSPSLPAQVERMSPQVEPMPSIGIDTIIN